MFYIFTSENITFLKYAFYFINNSLYFITLYIINMKMPTIVGIFIFINRDNFMLRSAEHEKIYITSGLTCPHAIKEETESYVPSRKQA